jgi:aspartate 1-decarboxylase
MDRILLKSKIHRATVTGADLHYEGSLAIDEDLMERADLLSGEQIHVFNIANGSRLITYAIAAPRHSGTILLNGAAARLGQVGDKVIIVAFANVPDEKARKWSPSIVHVDDRNRAEPAAVRRSTAPGPLPGQVRTSS